MEEQHDSSYSPASSAQVLNGSSRGFQHRRVLGLLQQRGVDADHLWLVQQLITCTKEEARVGKRGGRSKKCAEGEG